jgi:hypothetical protein
MGDQEQIIQELLGLLDEGAAIIQEMTAQLQAKNQQADGMNKKAEQLASETGLSYQEAEDMLKTAEAEPETAIFKIAAKLKSSASFGRVASDDLEKTASTALDKYRERQSAIMDELGIS